MEILPVLRLIWRRRILLVIATVAAIAVFVGLGGTKPASSSSAVAWTRVTLDTPKVSARRRRVKWLGYADLAFGSADARDGRRGPDARDRPALWSAHRRGQRCRLRRRRAAGSDVACAQRGKVDRRVRQALCGDPVRQGQFPSGHLARSGRAEPPRRRAARQRSSCRARVSVVSGRTGQVADQYRRGDGSAFSRSRSPRSRRCA